MNAPLPAVQHSPAARSNRTRRLSSSDLGERLVRADNCRIGCVLGEGGVRRFTHVNLHGSSVRRASLQNIAPAPHEHASCVILSALSERTPVALAAPAPPSGGKLIVLAKRTAKSGSRNSRHPKCFGGGLSTSMKALFTTLCCCLLLASARVASAEGARSAHADALLQQGEALLAANKVVAACAKFEASEAQETGLGTLLHLGDCYERAGRTASAWHAFLEAEAVASAKKDTERQQIAAARVAALEPQLSRVVFVVPSTSRVPGLTVHLGENTIPAGSWGAVIPVDAGVQHVTVSAKGHRSWQLDLTVAPEAREYRVNVPMLTPDAVPSADRRGALRTAGVITGGAGIAGIGAGAVFSALSRSADDASTCARGVIQCTPSRTTRNSYSDAATVSFAVGGTLLATGITLWVLAPAPDNKEKNAPLRVAARVAGDGGRLQLEGVW